MIRILVLARIRLYGEGLAECLSRHSAFNISGIASELSDAFSHLEEEEADVVLYDLSLQEGLKGIYALSHRHPHLKIIALAVSEITEEVIACAEAGISAYVSTEATVTQLGNAIIGATKGELYCPPSIACKLLEELRRRSNEEWPKEKNTYSLTRREKEILNLMVKGRCNKEIASELYISISTVKNHVHQILEKLHVRNRSEAVALAVKYQFALVSFPVKRTVHM